MCYTGNASLGKKRTDACRKPAGFAGGHADGYRKMTRSVHRDRSCRISGKGPCRQAGKEEIMLNWNNLDTTRAFEELKKAEKVDLTKAMV